MVLKLMKTVERYKDSLFVVTLSSGKAGDEEVRARRSRTTSDRYSATCGVVDGWG